MEDGRIEYKREVTDTLEKEVVAFLNTSGGEIHIGVNDNKTIYGIADPDLVQRQIVDRLKNNISPNILGLFDIVLEKEGPKYYVRIIVSAGSERPYYITRYGRTPKDCYIRVGSTCQMMNQEMIDSMYKNRVRPNLSIIPSPRQDLTFRDLQIYYSDRDIPFNRSWERNLEFLTPDDKYNYIAYLMADSNGMSFRVAKYRGTDKTDLISNDEYGYCCLIKATHAILERLKIENVTMSKITYPNRIEKKLIESIALREAVINMIVHNQYTYGYTPYVEIFSDRIDLTSHGGLVEDQSIDDFFSGISKPRNRELMRIFRDVDLTEQLGSGINRILKYYDKNIFTFGPNFIKVSFPFAKYEDLENRTVEEEKSDCRGRNQTVEEGESDCRSENRTVEKRRLKKNKIIEAIKENPSVTYLELVKITKVSRSMLAVYIKEMQSDGLIERIGSDRYGHWKIK